MSENVNKDFLRFEKDIKKSLTCFFELDSAITNELEKYHKNTYIIALILEKLKSIYKEENKIIFYAELLSDLLACSRLSLLGLENVSLMILRRAIENFYNHIYFIHHPIEYEHLNAGRNEYTPIMKLKEYLEGHPVFFSSEDTTIKEYNDRLFKEYHELCKVVHSKGRESMNLANCLKQLVNDFDIKEFLNRVSNIELLIVYLTYKFHKEIKFTAVEKSLIVSAVPSNKRGLLNI